MMSSVPKLPQIVVALAAEEILMHPLWVWATAFI
jgi:hypothetical protein